MSSAPFIQSHSSLSSWVIKAWVMSPPQVLPAPTSTPSSTTIAFVSIIFHSQGIRHQTSTSVLTVRPLEQTVQEVLLQVLEDSEKVWVKEGVCGGGACEYKIPTWPWPLTVVDVGRGKKRRDVSFVSPTQNDCRSARVPTRRYKSNGRLDPLWQDEMRSAVRHYIIEDATLLAIAAVMHFKSAGKPPLPTPLKIAWSNCMSSI